MTIMAVACGVLIVFLGLLSAGHNPTESQSIVEVVCLIGGLILCFLAVVLSRLTALGQRLDVFEAVQEVAAEPSMPAGAPAPASTPPPPAAGAAEPARGASFHPRAADTGKIEAVVVTKPPR